MREIAPAAPALEAEGVFTVAHLVASFEAHQTVLSRLGQTSAATLAWYSAALNKLTAAVGHFPAAELRAEHLVACKLTNHFVRVLKALYKWATDTDVSLLTRDPFRKLTVPKCGQRTRTLTPEEVERLLAVCSPEFAVLVLVALQCGARPGELRGWAWGQVDLPRRLVILTKFKAKDRRADGKGVRPIPLSAEAVELLARIRPSDPHPEALVFVNTRGKAWTGNALRCAMRVARKKAGLDGGGERVVCYTLRHTFGTNATRNNVSDRKLADIMGHSTTAMTARYQHLTAADLVGVIDQATARR